jgi:hypothetical protein
MTTEDRATSIGKLVLELGECTKNMTAIELEVDRVGDALKNTGSLLKLARRDPSEKALHEHALDIAIQQLPDHKKIESIVSDLRDVRKQEKELRDQAAKLRINL